ncbi:MAG: hypothetical protein ABIW84_07370 [Ilumatobacteraceae bacterium]
MNARCRRCLVGALGLMLTTAACASDDDQPRSVSTADAYVAAIRWYAASVPQPDSTAGTVDTGPATVYVAPADGNAIDAGAQASVISAMAEMEDTIEVIFADVRDDAIDINDENQPVKDEGALLLVGKVVSGPPPVEVTVEVYRSIDDTESFHMRIVPAGSDDYTVTAVTQLEQS